MKLIRFSSKFLTSKFVGQRVDYGRELFRPC